MARLKRRWFIIGGVILIVVILVVVGNLSRKSSSGLEVKVEKVSRRALATWVRAPGAIQAVTQVQLSSNVPGRVERLHVQEGEWVEKDQPLIDLDDTRYRSENEQYQAQLQAARSQLRRCETECELSGKNLDRKRQLRDQGLVSTEVFEEIEATFDVNQALCEAQQQELQRLQAALEAARRDLQETHLTAPISGLVTQILVEEGENVVTGTMNNPGTVILEIADLSEMEVEAQVDETDVISVSAGQSARVEVDALPNTILRGRVSLVGQAGRTSQEGADFLVRVRIQESPESLRPGMTADVEILVASADSALAVPLQSLTVRPISKIEEWKREEHDSLAASSKGGNKEGKKTDAAVSDKPVERSLDEWLTTGSNDEDELIEGVFIVEEGKARFRPVQTGIRGETHIQIIEGLGIDDSIITGPYRVLRTLESGTRVHVKEKEKENEKEEDVKE
ncbi:MAG: efflux RND transporter periplasmic adaptor subunit [Candidatus Eisenbacteria bacterium]|uniref:Efflux RND transporter periplasmic adaptor subunit n=1 Tax=Eiseniibacteriota bacterium TaxID=2212470 RepID=A0A948W674_UNCEI|nr:efflux RND transporter periplasmic adaptor subunit [Candidatus Eisenbacteria bacterium]MBU1947851.1 efflux RND transporter periplasmic adaptor subunit [Candidatus Eisenbacteria bacterium]MBU2690341.1 efflux RND transporter periplasmic adaptor subunit [Candidatus Eisenbacteria bacterium]